MKFRQFVSWTNDRACDGHWSMDNALICISVVEDIRRKLFWKREKIWKDKYESKIVNEIVNPTNELIRQYEEDLISQLPNK